MSRPISTLPVNVRAESIADLPDPDLVASLVDEAVAIDPRKAAGLISEDAELDVWVYPDHALVWVGDKVLARIPPKENEA